jgi:hypothetical protein
MTAVEGRPALARAATWRARTLATRSDVELGAPPWWMPRSGTPPLVKPHGTSQGLHRSVHAGRSSAGAGFALARVMDHEGRVLGLTTELDLIPLDRTRLVRPSAFRGVELGHDEDLPVGFVQKRWVPRYRQPEPGHATPDGSFAFREALRLVGPPARISGIAFRATPDGVLVPAASVLVIEKRRAFPSVAAGGRKWIDVSIQDQTLVAYEGTKAVYATLVSTGRAGLADPDTAPATVRGTFMIHAKHVSATMDDDADVSDSYSLRDVPFVQYFHKGYALHGAYWHDDFGKMRSHGCINLAPIDAAWLFEWTEPSVPEGWHSVINKERGTPMVIRR